MPELDLENALRDLPRPAFKRRLREMMEPQTLTPYITVRNVDALIDFVKTTFGAEELLRATGSAGGTHCEVRIADSKLMLGGGENVPPPETPTMLHYYVPDVDAMYERAIAAGAKSLGAPRDQEYGDRDCVVEDLAGNQWCLATSKGASYKPQELRAITMYLHPFGVTGLLDFIVRAFGAELLERHEAPDGTVPHAKARIGNSVLEMGEAHGQWQPMPSMIYLIVDDVDARYEQALAAGGKSSAPPADQSYGARTAAIEDPAGNQWYIAEPVRS
jgi:PhnB protein